jgi:hypothetical protein
MFTPPKPSSLVRSSSQLVHGLYQSQSLQRARPSRQIFQRLIQFGVTVFVKERLTSLSFGSVLQAGSSSLAHLARDSVRVHQRASAVCRRPEVDPLRQ